MLLERHSVRVRSWRSVARASGIVGGQAIISARIHEGGGAMVHLAPVA